jgi:beta-glucosidase
MVQMYVRDDAASVARPVRMLKGFRRLAFKPGETRRATLTLTANDLALYDPTMRRVVEPGTFSVFVGGSSAAGIEGRFDVTGDTLLLASPPPRPQ